MRGQALGFGTPTRPSESPWVNDRGLTLALPSEKRKSIAG
jgi:hypothetical protein